MTDAAELPELPIHDMAARHYGLTPGPALSYQEAARVCLDRHHKPPTNFNIRLRNQQSGVVVRWTPADARCQAAWANTDVATENAAYGCALAACEVTAQLHAVRRAETGTGADYYVAPEGFGVDDLEGCLRLEVSGTDHGSESLVEQRLQDKIAQARKGRSNLPAMAGVVGFRVRLIVMETIE